jgi:CRP/FNR family transcriptional regulator, cyclic AMP receptor protein
MIDATRSKVSFFMNRFRRMGFIDYNGRILVDKSLLNVVLHDEVPEQNTETPTLLRESTRRSKSVR